MVAVVGGGDCVVVVVVGFFFFLETDFLSPSSLFSPPPVSFQQWRPQTAQPPHPPPAISIPSHKHIHPQRTPYPLHPFPKTPKTPPPLPYAPDHTTPTIFPLSTSAYNPSHSRSNELGRVFQTPFSLPSGWCDFVQLNFGIRGE